MNCTRPARLTLRAWSAYGVALMGLAVVGLGCDDAPPSAKAPPTKPVEVKKVPLGRNEKNVWLEVQGDRRRVGVAAEVCLRKAGFGLECLLCRRNTKEHESILVTDADCRLIHAGLEACGGKPGTTVKYEQKGDDVIVRPPTGQKIRITLEYASKGKTISVPAQQWVRNIKTKQDLEHDWVFAGSKLIPNPEDAKKPPIYLAHNDGAFICISNVPTAMLDLPIDSPKGVEDRGYDTHEDRIPALGTKVTILLEPIPEKKK